MCQKAHLLFFVIFMMKVPTGFFSCPSSFLSYSRNKHTRYSDISPAARRKMRGAGTSPRRSLGGLLAGTWRPPEGGHLRTIACSSPVASGDNPVFICCSSIARRPGQAARRLRGGRREPSGGGWAQKKRGGCVYFDTPSLFTFIPVFQ